MSEDKVIGLPHSSGLIGRMLEPGLELSSFDLLPPISRFCAFLRHGDEDKYFSPKNRPLGWDRGSSRHYTSPAAVGEVLNSSILPLLLQDAAHC